jgi:serine/threonine protein phosphatase PrpC
VPFDFPTASIVIRTETPELFHNNVLLHDGACIVIPWLAIKKCKSIFSLRGALFLFALEKDPIGVWLYTIRQSLKKTDLCAWHTPAPIRPRFSMRQRVDWPVLIMAGVGRTKGRRPYMEDTDFSFDEIRISEKSRVSMFGVLDGHGGGECSKFAAEELPSGVILQMRSGKSGGEALYKSFLSADESFLNSTSSRAGSTATVLLWDHVDKVMSVANCGDTRAVLSRSGTSVDITRDMKATDLEEVARICQEGGFVLNGRVQGSLAIARTLGDKNLKLSDQKFLIPNPEITQFRLHEQDEFVVIATDGLWDVMSSQVYSQL